MIKRNTPISEFYRKFDHHMMFVFNVPLAVRSYRDGTPHLLYLAKDVKLGKYGTPFLPGIEPRAVV